MKNKKRLFYLVVILFGILSDQAVKYWASAYLKAEGTVRIINNIFHLTYAENTGAAFSMMEGGRIIFLVLTPIMLLVFAFLLFSGRIKNRGGEFCAALVIAGGLGNFIDRLFHGYVVDMFYFVPINFPIFNVADIYITCGVFLFIICYLVTKGEMIEWNTK